MPPTTLDTLLLGATALAPCVLVLVVLLAWSYPGRPVPPRGGIAEKVFVTINGVAQGLIITSRDPRHPVLLYLHGGMPDYFLARRHQARLDDDFTVCWWEQRGSGLSYRPSDPPPTLDQLLADALAVTDYLRRRLGTERIEDPARAQQILRQDVMRGDTSLADERAPSTL